MRLDSMSQIAAFALSEGMRTNRRTVWAAATPGHQAQSLICEIPEVSACSWSTRCTRWSIVDAFSVVC